MPIYEYKCSRCATKYDFFHKSSLNRDEVICPNCGSKESKKLFSAFATANSSDNEYTSSCAFGNCSTDYAGGGCASGMCGLN